MPKFPEAKPKLKDGSEVILRSLVPSDIPAFLKFQPQVAQETQFTMQMVGRLPPVDRVRKRWTAAELDPKELFLGAFSGEKLLGLLGFHPFTPPHPWANHVARFGMMVLKDYWGTGLSDLLIETMHTHARAVGMTRIEAAVRAENPRGIAFYQKHGYQIEGTHRHAAFIDGRYQDEHCIAILFDASLK